jgi:putative glutamine amidotransferase
MTRKRILIGVSRLSPNYASWLYQLHSGLELVDFYTLDASELAAQFDSISGLLLTGGGDVDPGLYDRAEDLPYCRGIDARRDRLETGLIDLAFELGIPILGICRGQQILNIVKGGSLYSDIPAFIQEPLEHYSESGDVWHPVSIDPGSLLFRLSRTTNGSVNSSHHQAINRIGDDLSASAVSSDGLAEAIEFKHAANHPFCLAVQWHPERMNIDDPLSGLLGRGFIEAASNKR